MFDYNVWMRNINQFIISVDLSDKALGWGFNKLKINTFICPNDCLSCFDDFRCSTCPPRSILTTEGRCICLPEYELGYRYPIRRTDI